MVVILKVGGLQPVADCIRAAIAQDALPWKLVQVSTLNQARLALGRDRVDLVLIHHRLPDGDALLSDLHTAGIPRVLSIEQGQEAVAARALEQGFEGFVVEAVHDGFGAVLVAQLRSALRHRETARTLHQQHGLLSAISRAQASFIETADNRSAFESLLNDLLSLTRSRFGFVAEVAVDPANGARTVVTRAVSNLAWDDASRRTYQAGADASALALPDALVAPVLQNGEPLRLDVLPPDVRGPGQLLLQSYLGLPVARGPQMLAVVGLANRPGGYLERQVTYLKPLLDTIGQLVVARRAETDRRHTLEVLQTTLDAMDQGLTMTDATGHFVLCNRRALVLLEVSAELMAARPHQNELVALLRERGDYGPECAWVDDSARAYLVDPLSGAQPPSHYRRRTRDGRVLEVHIRTLVGGETVRTFTDVTEAARSQAALRAAGERLAAILEGTRAGTWEWHVPTDEVTVNDRFASLVGHTPDELPRRVSDLYALLLHPADADRLHQANQRHLRGETDHYECEFRFRHRLGHWVWLMERGRINQRGPDGEVLMMSGTTLDISESKRAEDALRITGELLKERTAALEATLQAMTQGLLVVGPEGRVRLYNAQVLHILSLPEAVMAGHPALADVVAFQTRRGDFGEGLSLVEPAFRPYFQTAITEVGESVPRRYVRRTREGRHLEIKSNPLPGGGFVRTFTDVTPFVDAVEAARESGEEVRRLNETLEQRVAQRTVELERTMHDIEALSYSIAHDLRGPLRAVNGFAALIAADEADRLSADGRELFERITEASRRMGEMITDLLELFKVVRADIVPVDVDLGALAQEAVRSLASAYPNTRVEVEPMPLARGDVSLLRLLMFNLVDNALKYSAKAAEPCITVGWRLEANAWFVRDNGVGFDMSRADKLFGLFQRLHSPAEFEGSGVGLAVVARVVERHGGTIWAEAQPGSGSTFWFRLASDGPALPLRPPRLPGQAALFDA